MTKLTFAAGALSLIVAHTPASAADHGADYLSQASPSLKGHASMAIGGAKSVTGSTSSQFGTRSAAQSPAKSIRLAKKKSGKSLAKIRAAAISRSMVRLERLRPFASNFARLKAAVRAYWQRNAHRPNAGQLTSTILRHVAPEHRSLVRDPVYQSALDGTRKVRAALAK